MRRQQDGFLGRLQTNPPGVDGAILRGPSFPRPIAAFAATVQNSTNQLPAEISYLGPVPGAVAGSMQVNVRIPDSVPPGPNSLFLSSVLRDSYTQLQSIYMLSDPPVLTSTTPASPIPQTQGNGAYLTLNGANLNSIVSVNFFSGQKSITFPQQAFGSCMPTACAGYLYFDGQSGEFGVEVVNAAGQVSNRLTFTVLPIGN